MMSTILLRIQYVERGAKIMSKGSKATSGANAVRSRWFGCGGVGTGLAVVGMLAGTAGAAEYDENPDAGDIASTAQSTVGPASTALDAINGNIENDSDQDMFKIFIDDPVAFSASTNNSGTTLPGGDTMLYLFDENGVSVLASDDIDGVNFKTTLSAGSLDDAGGGAGVYHIAVSKSYNFPSSNAGDVFAGEIWNPDRLAEANTTLDINFIPNRETSGWDQPVAAWGFEPFDSEVGDYRIELTGASFAEEASASVPAMGPAASVGLSLLLSACGIGALRVRSSRKELNS